MYVLTFPGQGSQSVGMLTELAAEYPIVQQTFAEASEVLGYDAWQLASQGPEAQLNETEFTQPVLLAADVAVYRCWQSHHPVLPHFMAGHSLGEYAALVCTGALRFSDAIRLVAFRGKFMAEAVPSGQGAMAAIVGLEDSVLLECCHEAQNLGLVSPANFNSIGQTVVAGEKAAVEKCVELAKTRGAKIAKLIPVSVPSHCALMKNAQLKLKPYLDQVTLNIPEIPVIQNVDVHSHTDSAIIKKMLVEQLVAPVRWVETIQYCIAQGITKIIECGPGKVLTGLAKRIDRTVVAVNMDTAAAISENLKLIA